MIGKGRILSEPLDEVALDRDKAGLKVALEPGDVLGQFGIEGRGSGSFSIIG
jgi:hypothetical protein